MAPSKQSVLALLAAVPGTSGLVASPAPRGVVSFELSDIFYDSKMVKQGASSELQVWLRDKLRVSRLSHYEPHDVYTQFEALQEQGSDFGFLLPGVSNAMREAILLSTADSGLEQAELQKVADEAVGLWLQAHDSFAEQLLEPAAVPALRALRERGYAVCCVTDTFGDSSRMPSLAAELDFTLCTYDFTVGAGEAWDVAFQVAPALKYKPGVPWLHVGGGSEGGLAAAAAAGIKTVALGNADSLQGASPTARVASLAELPAAVEGFLPSE